MKILLLFLLVAQIAFSQQNISANAVQLELSMQHDDGPCSYSPTANVIIRNNSDSVIRFYENWTSYGFYNFHFEIETADTVYCIVRPNRLWYRNYPCNYSVNPGESLVFSFLLIDTACAAAHSTDEYGWTGFPTEKLVNATIRVVYEIDPENSSYPLHTFGYEFVEGAKEGEEWLKKLPPQKQQYVFIYDEKLVSNKLRLTNSTKQH